MDRPAANVLHRGMGPQSGTPTELPTVDSRSLFGRMEDATPSANGVTSRSTRARGSITLKRKGVWRIRWSHGRDPDTDQRVRRKKAVHGTKKDAERALTAELRRIDLGHMPRPARLTLGVWLERWLGQWCSGLAERTRYSYEEIIRARVPERLLRRNLTALSASDLQTLFNDMTARGPSPRTVQGARAVLRAAGP